MTIIQEDRRKKAELPPEVIAHFNLQLQMAMHHASDRDQGLGYLMYAEGIIAALMITLQIDQEQYRAMKGQVHTIRCKIMGVQP